VRKKVDRVKIGAYIRKEVADRLYGFVRKHYDKPYGKLSEVIERALEIGLEVMEREASKESEK